MKIYNVLWTGGMDSTFRVVQLSRLPVRICPYYLIIEHRKTTENELNAIYSITDELRTHPDTKCILDDITVVKAQELESQKEIDDAFARLSDRANKLNKIKMPNWPFEKQEMGIQVFLADYYLPHQYHRCSYLSYQLGMIDLSMHMDDERTLRTFKALGAYFKKIITDNKGGGTFILDQDKSDKDMLTIFGHMSFPLLEYDKDKEKEFFLQSGYSNIFNMTWFCYSPKDNKPCGHCLTCLAAIREGMSERFSAEAISEYNKLENRLDKIEKIYRREN